MSALSGNGGYIRDSAVMLRSRWFQHSPQKQIILLYQCINPLAIWRLTALFAGLCAAELRERRRWP